MAEEPVKRKRIPSERKYELIDLPTPVNAPLSGQYRRSVKLSTLSFFLNKNCIKENKTRYRSERRLKQ